LRIDSEIIRFGRAAHQLDSGHVRIRVTNIGASKVTLRQYGTGLKISFPSEQQPATRAASRRRQRPRVLDRMD